MASRVDAIAVSGTPDYSIWRVILASSVGTMLEWYDFYIFGRLAVVLSQPFYSLGNASISFIAYLSPFAIRFLVRPFAPLFFRTLVDLVVPLYVFLL